MLWLDGQEAGILGAFCLARILPLCLDALCQILINKMIPNCILSKEGYNTGCF